MNCATDKNSWDDMADDLFDKPATSAEDLGPDQNATIDKIFHSRCRKCGGSGRYGMFGKCFTCNGAGQIATKTDPRVLANARAQRQIRQEREANELAATVQAWKDENSAEWGWIERNMEGFEFAASLSQQLHRRGYLSPNQMAAIQRCLEREAARRVSRQAYTAEAPKIESTEIEECFRRAKAKGVARPKLSLSKFRFSLAPTNGANAGAIYVKERERDGQYLGKVMGGKLLLVPSARHLEAEVKAVMEDPKSAAIAYGKEFGICAVCNRDLSDPVSVANGIGPICAGRFGW